MQKPIRIGVVGLGFAGERLLKIMLEMPGCQVMGLADADEGRLKALQARYNVPDVYADYNDLVVRDDLDAVAIATPNYLHAPVAILALQHGKHVLTEKPLAHNYAEGRRMVEAARAAGRVLKVVFNRRFRGDMQVLKRYIDDGGLGRIYHAKAYWVRRNGIPGMGGWFTTHSLSGGGPLIDLGVHVLDMALHLMQQPVALAVSGATYAEFGPRGRGARSTPGKNAYDVEDLAVAFIRLEDGATLQLEASWATYRESGNLFGVRLYGTEGGAVIDAVNYNRRETLRIFNDTGGVPTVIQPQHPEGEVHAGVVREFLEIVRGDAWEGHDGRDGLQLAKIIEACYLSAKLGREVRLEDLE